MILCPSLPSKPPLPPLEPMKLNSRIGGPMLSEIRMNRDAR